MTVHLTHGLASRRTRNASLRGIGEEPPPGWNGGVKRWARFHARLYGTMAVKITPERKLRHLHSRARRWVQLAAFVGRDPFVERDCVLLDGTCDCPTHPDRLIPECRRHA